MSTYSIRDLERLSNLKAHTIRIWEQRYGLLQPERTESNIRFYNDDHLKKLLNVCVLLDRGMKISHISRLSNEEIRNEIEKAIQESYTDDRYLNPVISQALIAIATYNEKVINGLIDQTIRHLGMRDTYMKLIYPMLVRTGLMWTKDDLLPSQEHFLSNIVRRKLFSAIDQLPIPENPAQTWVLFLNEDEDHEIGLLFAYYMIRQQGHRAVYLGARVPYHDLSNVINNCLPTHICTFIVRQRPQEETERFIQNLINDFGQVRLCVSGKTDGIQETDLQHKVTVLRHIDNLLDLLNTSN
ncbi:HTH-type transcriptional repressor CarH [Dyadobacter sp. CECT 9275]|uniref:HTH-type transcriptional repressor CarH n=1 Tax=Dyadobacter helix TaxID=2822344 RepID=A0A916NE55_9BACT|nr:MerR family transcriptional regulator [Dyadobacter sp. CECT 9275]CAG5017556.1 HTH-type transcriptional repressor CarH [Dyadobacter sp. CECT 9275]